MGIELFRQQDSNWRFASEVRLEDFVWEHLDALMGLVPLARQYYVGSDVCDIIAMDPDGRAVVVELKNEEDRHVVSQITRYCHALTIEKPFAEKVDYSLGVRPVIVAPVFHRHNAVDLLYNRLPIEFLLYSLVVENGSFVLELRSTEGATVARLPLEVGPPQQQAVVSLPPPGRAFLRLTATLDPAAAQLARQFRETLYTLHSGVQEKVVGEAVRWSAGNKEIAEARTQRDSSLALFVWLPQARVVNRTRNSPASILGARVVHLGSPVRTRLWLEGNKLKALGHFPRGGGDSGIVGEYWTEGKDPKEFLRRRIDHHGRKRGESSLDTWTPQRWVEAPLQLYLERVGLPFPASLDDLLRFTGTDQGSNPLVSREEEEGATDRSEETAAGKSTVLYVDDNGNVLEVAVARYMGEPPLGPAIGKRSSRWLRRAVYKYSAQLLIGENPDGTPWMKERDLASATAVVLDKKTFDALPQYGWGTNLPVHEGIIGKPFPTPETPGHWYFSGKEKERGIG